MTQLGPDQTPEGWGTSSEGYETSIASFTAKYAADALRCAEFDQNAEVLDIASGTGVLALLAASQVSKVVATDFAPQMIERLRRNIEREGVNNVETAVMDGQALDVNDESFDGVLCNFGAIFFPDRVKGFSEMCRVLRPGGRAVVTSWSMNFEALTALITAVKTAVPDLPDPPRPPAVFSLSDAEQFEAEMRQGGFSEVRVQSFTHHFECASPEEFWDSIKEAAPPPKLLLERIGPDKAAEARDACIAQLGARFPAGPVRLPCEAYLAVGVR